ncbi:MAG: hypothetical protein GQ574_10045 [Crocinitomix sp.]|nr:hypothetical protein [Crocinitomix sp.]
MIEILNNLHSLFSFYVLRHLALIILFLIVIDFFWKKQNFKFSYAVIRYIILINWALNFMLLIFSLDVHLTFLNRATGLYWWAYQFMLFGSFVLPVLLFHKKMGRNKWILLTVGFLSTFGLSFELFVNLITSFHQDYLPSSTVPFYVSHLFLRAIMMASFLVGIDVLVHKFRTDKKELVNQDVLDGD